MRLVVAHVDENYLRGLRALFKYTPVTTNKVVPVVMPVKPDALYASLRKTHNAPVAMLTTTSMDAHALQSALTYLVQRGEHDVVVVQPPADVRLLYTAVVNAMAASPLNAMGASPSK